MGLIYFWLLPEPLRGGWGEASSGPSFPLSRGGCAPPPFSCSVGPTLQMGSSPGNLLSVALFHCRPWRREHPSTESSRGVAFTPMAGLPPRPLHMSRGSRLSAILRFVSRHTAELSTNWFGQRSGQGSVRPSSPTCAVGRCCGNPSRPGAGDAGFLGPQ